jgi:hypothetical protein
MEDKGLWIHHFDEVSDGRTARDKFLLIAMKIRFRM